MDDLNKHLALQTYMLGDNYTIADMAIWLWYGQLAYGQMRKNGQQELGALEEQEASK
jgi:GST-like protein